jgi:hypothetical protein
MEGVSPFIEVETLYRGDSVEWPYITFTNTIPLGSDMCL